MTLNYENSIKFCFLSVFIYRQYWANSTTSRRCHWSPNSVANNLG